MRKRYTTHVPGKWLALACALPVLLSSAAYGQYAQKNVVQPSDPIIASSANSPASEGVANAIDGTTAKYLNFDMANDAKPAGFIVTPSVGATWVTGVAIESANDSPDRDVKEFTLEGSNDDPSTFTNFAAGNWTLIADVANIVSNNTRYAVSTFQFTNFAAFKSYRWTVLHTQGPSGCCMQVAEVQLLGTALPKNVTQPSDAIIGSSANSPASEGVANAIDGTTAKYLNFDMANDAKPAGFVVTPSVGATVINGVTLESANDSPDRDPKEFTIEGSNDDAVTNFSGGNWTLIAHVSNIVSNNTRYAFATFLFPNVQPYLHYRWTVLHTQGPSGCCMQIAEVELLGSGAPKNVVVPSDPIIGSSANSPASEGVANAIDGTTAKYLNFDMANDAKPAGFVVTPSVGATAVIGVGIESANDSPDRDVKEFTLEGSNDASVTNFTDGNWSVIAHVSNITSNNTRYAWSYFYFQNQTPYTHYRWTVLHTQGPSGCCMQVAEVQLLAITSQADCTKAAFVSRPTDTPGLLGSPAEFFVTVNGPWPLQWMVNGAPVPGATKTSFSTDPLTSSVVTNLYSVAIVGCQTSAPVHAVIFTPSPTKSIGVQFAGGGANGTPEYMFSNDIAGVQLQSYWNVAVGGGGSIGDPNNPGTSVTNALGNTDFLTDSTGDTNEITFTYTTSGTWGAGIDTSEPVGRMLNGLVASGAGAQQVFTFGNVPPGTTNAILLYSIAPPAQAGGRASYNITNAASGVAGPLTYMTVYSSDQYKQAPGFYRSTSTSATSPAAGDFVRFDGVVPDANSNITVVVVALDSETRNYGVNAIQLVINAPNPGSPPQITQDLQPVVGPTNGTVTLTVGATGTGLTYQWRRNGVPLQNGGNISGATSATLTISGLNSSDVGIYSVAIFSPAGSTVSANASVNVSAYNIKDALVDYWKLDETSGTNAANVATGGQRAVVFTAATPTWVPGKVGNAYSFDGGSFLYVTNYSKASAGITASAWVNMGGTAPGVNQAVIQNAQPSLYTLGGNGVRVIGAFELNLIYDVASGNVYPEAGVGVGAGIFTVTGTTPVPVSGWHQVAFTADGAQVRVYVDGQLSGQTPYSGNIASPDIPYLSIGARLNVDTNSVIGVSPNPGEYSSSPAGATDAEYASFSLDELALWDRALPPSEITALFTAENSGKALDTVVLTPPATSSTLHASIAGGQITVTWTSGTLQSASSLTGAWTDVSGATGGTHTEAVTAGAKFFRTR